MPKSKRAKVVHLTKTGQKGRDLKATLYANIQSCATTYPYIYVLAVENMRNNHLKDVRAHFKTDSRLFFGKTKVMALALGRTASDAPFPGTHGLSPLVSGSVGLLFTSRPPSSVLAFFSSFTPASFARAGNKATRAFIIPAGPVYSTAGEVPEEDDVPVAANIEPNLRALGVPTRLVKGKVVLELQDESMDEGEGGERRGYVVCKEGEELSSRQTTILKTFGVAMAEFRVWVRTYWEARTGEVVVVDGASASEEVEMDVDEVEE